MKHRTPQPEFLLPDEPFRLVPESTLDGHRLAQERDQSAADRAGAEQCQIMITALPRTDTILSFEV